MASHGIRDQVAIVGMGCTNFGEHWDKSTDDMLIDSSSAALKSAGIALDDVDAFWLGTMGSGLSGLTLSRPLKIDHKPVTHVENFCATGSEAFRNACYAVASGAYDVAMAIGVEKLKDSGYSGLVVSAPANDGTSATVTAPASFSLLAPAYAKKYGVDPDEMKDVLTRIAWKNHKNGALNPRAQFRKEVSKETIACSPIVAGPLGIFDCSGVSDGSAAAIVVRAEDAHRYTRPPAVREGAVVHRRSGRRSDRPELRLHELHRGRALGRGRLPAGRHRGPAGRAGDGRGARLLHADRAGADGGPRVRRARLRLEGGASPGRTTSTASCPVNPDGGLKSFGHPIGASGPAHAVRGVDPAARRGRRPPDRVASRSGKRKALTHNLGGSPGACVSFVSVVGDQPDA